ncbi:MAG: ABC transporter permease [Propionibacteriaceae bacterium]|jgi:putative ABC transport system permease protein|nr:ABC transporter permease [Propionibacteriaceae bacterium]
MTSVKLALRNVKKSIRDYTIYFLTLTFGVCVFYIFNALESQSTMMKVTKNQALLFKELSAIMDTASVFVSIILGFLIVYANRFLIRRRKKELGIYMILGMRKGEISRILIMETVFVGVFSLIAGLALGAVAAQGMALLTANLMQSTITDFSFRISTDSALETIAYFALIFLLVLIFNTLTLSRQKLIDLLYANRKNERFEPPRLSRSVAVFLIAVGCLAYAYWSMLSKGAQSLLDNNTIPVATLLGIAGSFLFFYSMSGFIIKVVQQSKRFYLKNLNMFVLRQLSSKFNTTFVSITMVCLLLFISISTLSSGMALSNSITEKLRKHAPFDATLSILAKTDKNGHPLDPYPGVNIVNAFKQNGVQLDALAKNYLTVRYHTIDKSVKLTVVNNGVTETASLNSYLLTLSDYNKILALQGLAPITLNSGEYAVNSAISNATYRSAINEYMTHADTIAVEGATLRTGPQKFYTHTLEDSQNEDYRLTFVVPDGMTADLPVFRDVLHVIYPEQTPQYEEQFLSGAAKLHFGPTIDVGAQTRVSVSQYSNSATTLIAYLAVYLGIIFLITSAAVLAIRQLSETSDNIQRYGLLRKLGAEEKMINKSLFAQISIYFGAPLLLALAHTTVGIFFISHLVETFNATSILGSSLVTAAVLLTIYGGYFLATYLGSKGILKRDYSMRAYAE